jgi:hypothetical protein
MQVVQVYFSQSFFQGPAGNAVLQRAFQKLGNGGNNIDTHDL